MSDPVLPNTLGNEQKKFVDNGNGPAVRVVEMDGGLQWDTTSTANNIYVGDAGPGTLTSVAAWRIQKIDTSTGTISWADGDTLYDNIWDNRTSLSYS